MLGYVAMMHYESPDYRLDDSDSDLAEWYSAAAEDARQQLVRYAELPPDEFDKIPANSFFESIAIFEGYNDARYALRDFDWFEVSCPSCDASLIASFEDRRFRIWKESDNSLDSEELSGLKRDVTPCEDMKKALEDEYHSDLAKLHSLFELGAHEHMIHWLRQLCGRFACPECEASVPIRYKWND